MVDLGDGSFKYKAFLSYNRADRAVARQIQAQLEAFVLPPSLRGADLGGPRRGRRLNPIFRDETELVAGTDLPQRIEAALRDSEFLIVIASPSAARSEWVEKEILSFARLGRVDNIVTVVVGGEGDLRFAGTASDPLPRALRYRLTPDGRMSGDPTEPLWIDWRNKAERRTSLLRLVAALLRLESVDDLIRRDMASRRRSARRWVAAGVVLVVLAVAALTTMIGMERSAAKREALVLARLARNAADAGDFKSAARYALLSATRGRNRLIPFTTPESEAELRNAALQAPRPLRRFSLGAGLHTVRFLDDGRTIIGASHNAAVIVDAETGRVRHTLQGFGANIAGLFVSSDRSRFLITTNTGVIRVFDTATLRQVAAWRLPDFAAAPEAIFTYAMLSPDGRRLTAFDHDRLWRWADVNAAPTIQRLPETTWGVSLDGRYAVMGDPSAIYEFDVDAQRRLGHVEAAGIAYDVRYSDDSQFLSFGSGNADLPAQIYLSRRNAESEEPSLHLRPISVDTQYYDVLRGLSLSPTGDRFLAAWSDLSSDRTGYRLLTWTIRVTGEGTTASYRVLAENRGAEFIAADLAQGASRVVSATQGGQVTLWDVLSYDPPQERRWNRVIGPAPPYPSPGDPSAEPVQYGVRDQPSSLRRPDGSTIRRLAPNEHLAGFDRRTATVAIRQGRTISFLDGNDGRIKFRIAQPAELPDEISGFCESSVAFPPSDPRRVVVSWCVRQHGYMTSVFRYQVYDVPDATPVGPLSAEFGGGQSLSARDITPDGRYALVEMESGPVMLDVATGRRIGPSMAWLRGDESQFAPDGRNVLGVAEDRGQRQQVSWSLDPFYFTSLEELVRYACDDLLAGGFDRLTRAELEAAPFLDPDRDAAVCQPVARTWFSI